MDPRFSFDQVQHVPVLYWPWVWWQLFWLRAWCDAASSKVLYEIEPDGRVVIAYASDDARDLTSWVKRAQSEGWAHHEAMYKDRYTLGVAVIPILIGTALERFGCFIRYIAKRSFHRPVPDVQDSS